MSTADHIPPRLAVVVSDDRLNAWVRLPGLGTPAFTPPPEVDVLAALDHAHIAVTDAVTARVHALVNPPAGELAPTDSDLFLVAQGRPAVDATDGRLEWSPTLVASAPADEVGRIDYFARSTIVTVAADTVIGRVIPPTPGTPALDVYGHEHPPHRPRGLEFTLGPGAAWQSGTTDVAVATVAGRVLCRDGQIRVCDLLEIPGDVDLSTGSIESCVDVFVRGTVRSNFHVRTDKSLEVDKLIESADVRAAGNVVVHGGVFGHNGQGRVRAGGSVTALLLDETRVDAGGDIRFKKEIINSQVRTHGLLLGDFGTVIGGSVYAREGARVRIIGSEAAIMTHVATGIHHDVLRRTRQIDRQLRDTRKAAEQIRTALAPLLANLKRLLPAQREQATELMCKADELDLFVDDQQKRAQQLLTAGQPVGEPYILISEMAFPGTHLAVGARVLVLHKAMHGPVRIELRKVNDVTELVAVNQRTGSVLVLPGAEPNLDQAPAANDEFFEELLTDGTHAQCTHNRT